MTGGRFNVGDVVRVVRKNDSPGWTEEARNARASIPIGSDGAVLAVHDSHGLCYDVWSASGPVACFDHDELEPIGYNAMKRIDELEQALSDLNAVDVPEETFKARKRVHELEEAIRKHRDYRGQDRCHQDDLELYAVLGEEVDPEAFALPPCDQFIERCVQFWRTRKSAEVDASRRRATDRLSFYDAILEKTRELAAEGKIPPNPDGD